MRRFWPLPLFLVLSCLFLWRPVLAGQAFLPARLLWHVHPWAESHPEAERPPWNPLMYDSVGQFHPWRTHAARSLRAGRIPLWNPFQFSGAPFLANSQSAVLYPGNLLHVLLGPLAAAAWSAVLHMTLAAGFTWLLLRHLGAHSAAGALAGIAFAFSLWQVSWLHLPTFLATSAWLPLVLLLVVRLAERPAFRRAAGLGGTLALCLLAGHLQIAFYVLLAAALALGALVLRPRGPSRAALVAGFAGALVLAGLLAAPQLLPALELSRQSHRAGPPTTQGYAAYTAYAVSPRSLATLFVPDFFVNPSRPTAPHFGASPAGAYFNYAEGALYVGLPTLLLAACALLRRRQKGRLLGLFGILALLALLMALGTAVNALFYFGIPGFGQSGSPGRALVLWAFAVACLAGLGMDKLLRDQATPVRTAAAAIGGVLLLAGGALALGWPAVREAGVLPDLWRPELPRQAGLFALGAIALAALASGRLRTGWMAWIPVLLVTADLFAAGINFNPTSRTDEVYPETPLIAALGARAGHDRIMPVNRSWSFAGPAAVLPPNNAMVFGLRDVQGYDSLFPGQYKAFMNRLAGEGRDSSPPEVGNMVFATEPSSPLALEAGVRIILSLEPLGLPGARESRIGSVWVAELVHAPGRARVEPEDGSRGAVAFLRDEATRVDLQVHAPAPASLVLADQIYPGWRAWVDGRPAHIERTGGVFRRVRVPAGVHRVAFRFQPASFRTGLYLGLLALLVLGGCLVGPAHRSGNRRPGQGIHQRRQSSLARPREAS